MYCANPWMNTLGLRTKRGENPSTNEIFLDTKFHCTYKRCSYCSQNTLTVEIVHGTAATIRKVFSMAEIREVMDIRAASEYLGVSREILYKYVYEEKIPAFKLGNRWKFKKTLLDRWMEKQSAQFEQRSTRRLRATVR